MRGLWVLVGLGLASPALAQDWTGLYLGAHGGYAWGSHEGVGTYTDNTGAYKILDPETGSLDVEGGFGGGQLGFTVQRDALVFGIEGDGSWGGLNGEGDFISDANDNGQADYTWNIKTEVEWLATLRGRVGVLVRPDLLLYGTGGVAWAGINSDEKVTCRIEQCGAGNDPTTVLASASETATGWVAGAGLEWAFTPRWSLKTEWQHLQFDDLDGKFSGTAYPDNDPQPKIDGYTNDSFPGSLSIDRVMLGINYKFGGAEPVAAPLK